MGYAFYVAQRGGKHRDSKLLGGFGGAGVLAYTVRLAGVVYVLHAFQKKSKTGAKIPRRDVELIRQRLHEAEQIAKERER